MKRLLAVILVLNLFSVAWPAAAQPAGRRFEQRPEQSRPSGPPPDAQRRPPQRHDTSWPRDAQEQPGHGRMSPEERRQLRRDINSHGRDIYREGQGRK